MIFLKLILKLEMEKKVMMTSLFSLRMIDLDLDEVERTKTIKKNKEYLDKEFEFRQAQIKKIQDIFLKIKLFLQPFLESEGLLQKAYLALNHSIAEFQGTLISEAANSDIGNNDPIKTAKHLEETIYTVLDTKNNLQEKNKSIIDFRNEARHAKFSSATKAAWGAVIGGLIPIAIFGMVCFACPAMFLFPVISIIAMVGLVGLGASQGARIGLVISEGQDDDRGNKVSDNLQTLLKEKNKLFHKTNKKVSQYQQEEMNNKKECFCP